MTEDTENTAMGIFKKRFKATQLKSADEFEQLLGDGRPLLIDFYTEW